MVRRNVVRRVVGLVWLATWCAVLWAVAAPWRHLGGLVSERLRWLEWWALGAGLILGFTVGRAGRIAAERRGRWTHLSMVRGLVVPMAALTAATCVVLTVLELRDPVGVVVTALVSYWAGADLAFAAVPMLDGKPYAPEPFASTETDRAIDGSSWIPPWERF